LFTRPQAYFKIPGNQGDYTREEILAMHRSKLESLDILFLFQINRSSLINSLRASGTEILKMIPEKYEVDLASKYRREQFAKYLAERIGLSYGVMGQHEFFFRDWVLEEIVEKHDIERENERKAFLEMQEREKKAMAKEALRLKQNAERAKRVEALREAKSKGKDVNDFELENITENPEGNNNISSSIPAPSLSSGAVNKNDKEIVANGSVDKDDATINATAAMVAEGK